MLAPILLTTAFAATFLDVKVYSSTNGECEGDITAEESVDLCRTYSEATGTAYDADCNYDCQEWLTGQQSASAAFSGFDVCVDLPLFGSDRMYSCRQININLIVGAVCGGIAVCCFIGVMIYLYKRTKTGLAWNNGEAGASV